MGKHTLRNVGERPKTIKKKPIKKKKSILQPRILIIAAILILIVSTLAANAILFAKNYYYLDACDIGYNTECEDSFKNDIVTYVILILLPIVLATYAIIRAFQKRQNVLTSICIVCIAFSLSLPFALAYLHTAQIEKYSNSVILSIKTPDSQNDCELIGITVNDSSTCKIQTDAYLYQLNQVHNRAVVPVRINNDQIIVHLDSNLNLFNITKQNLYVCSYFIGGNPDGRCQRLSYSAKDASVAEDDSYTYTYLNNQLTITAK